MDRSASTEARYQAERKHKIYEMITDQWINIVIANIRQEQSWKESISIQEKQSSFQFENDSQFEKLSDVQDSEVLKDQLFQSIVRNTIDNFNRESNHKSNESKEYSNGDDKGNQTMHLYDTSDYHLQTESDIPTAQEI